MNTKEITDKIIKLANDVCKRGQAMDYPDYDEETPLTTLEEALALFVWELQPHDEEDPISGEEAYDFFVNLLCH